jgi:hypothetical protein
MERREPIDAETLFDEVVRYLAAVDAFRAERCEPMWRPERVPSEAFESNPQLSRTSGSRRSGTRRPHA